jgi:hypothetical protein
VDDATVLQIFQRINSTGLKLNAQELRNATWFGEFKDFSYRLAYEQLQRWISWQLFDRQKLGQMLEVEFTADLLGLLIEGVLSRTKSTIDRLYKNYDEELKHQEDLAETFVRAFDFLDKVYRPGAARSTLRRFRSTTWLYASFALVTAADRIDVLGNTRPKKRPVRPIDDSEILIRILERAEVELRRDDLNPDLAKKLRGATSDRSSREERIRFLRSLA